MVGRKVSADSDEPGWNVAMDFILALFPVSIVYSLQIATSKKIAICILLGLGLLYVCLTPSSAKEGPLSFCP